MAYMNQSKKKVIAESLKPILKKYGIKGSLSVRNHSTITLSIKEGSIDFLSNIKSNTGNDYRFHLDAGYVDVNPYWYHEHFSGQAREFLETVFKAMKSADWYDRTDAQVDYFDTAYYVHVNIGQWKKPYKLVERK